MTTLRAAKYRTEVPCETALAIIDMSERYSMKHFHSRKNFPVSFQQILSEIYLMGFMHAFEAMDAADAKGKIAETEDGQS